ncbi:MAG: hypothetical protein J6Y33_01760 [Prevotella sp.]|nr:hypothetical protein [Prevotella sp.]
MKKLMMMVAVALMTAVSANAQSELPKNEIGISYGLGVSAIGDGIGNGIGTGLFDGMTGRKWTNEKNFGTLAIEYYRHLDNTPKLAVGGILTYAQMGEDVEYKGKTEGERTRTWMSLMPSVKYYWSQNKNFGFYSKLGAGVMMLHSKNEDFVDHETSTDSKFYFMWQASLLGAEVGSKNLRGFVELGVGEQGIALAGLRVKF